MQFIIALLWTGELRVICNHTQRSYPSHNILVGFQYPVGDSLSQLSGGVETGGGLTSGSNNNNGEVAALSNIANLGLGWVLLITALSLLLVAILIVVAIKLIFLDKDE